MWDMRKNIDELRFLRNFNLSTESICYLLLYDMILTETQIDAITKHGVKYFDLKKILFNKKFNFDYPIDLLVAISCKLLVLIDVDKTFLNHAKSFVLAYFDKLSMFPSFVALIQKYLLLIEG